MTTAEAQSLCPIHWADLEVRDRPPYLVKNWLNAGRFSVLYGEPGSMKTFVALDLAANLAIASKDAERRWHGHRLRGGPVLYIACEGGGSFEDRLAAFCLTHEVERREIPFYVLPQPIDLGDPAGGDAPRLIEAVKAMGGVSLIIVDTLSRALFGGNENSPDAMGAFVAVVDAIRAATDAHVMVIHHTGKDVERGARGHSSLKAAADTELVVTRKDGVVVVRTTKQRDLADGLDIAFRWKEVEVGIDEDGDTLHSLVLEPTEDRPEPALEKRSKANEIALDVLWKAIKSKDAVPGGGDQGPPIQPNRHAILEDQWRGLCYDAGISGGSQEAKKKAFQRARKDLLDADKIGIHEGWVWPWWAEDGNAPSML